MSVKEGKCRWSLITRMINDPDQVPRNKKWASYRHWNWGIKEKPWSVKSDMGVNHVSKVDYQGKVIERKGQQIGMYQEKDQWVESDTRVNLCIESGVSGQSC